MFSGLDVLTTDVLDEFCEAMGQLDSGDDVMSLWNQWLELSMSHKTSQELQRVYQRCVAVCSDNEVITKITESYLELIVLKDGIKTARKLYKRYDT